MTNRHIESINQGLHQIKQFCYTVCLVEAKEEWITTHADSESKELWDSFLASLYNCITCVSDFPYFNNADFPALILLASM